MSPDADISKPSGEPSKDAHDLLVFLCEIERRLNSVASNAADVADRMWGCRPATAEARGGENASPGHHFARLQLAMSNVANAVSRIEEAAKRFERLA